MNRKSIYAALLLVVGLAAACAPLVSEPTPTPTRVLPQGVKAAKEALGESEDIALDQIDVVSYESRDWSDGCLGLGRADEGCIQVITPGYRVVLEAEGEQYVYRTDLAGDVVRREE